MNWYQLEVRQIFEKLGTSEEGLSVREAGERLEKYGLNKLAEEERISRLKILLHQFAYLYLADCRFCYSAVERIH